MMLAGPLHDGTAAKLDAMAARHDGMAARPDGMVAENYGKDIKHGLKALVVSNHAVEV